MVPNFDRCPHVSKPNDTAARAVVGGGSFDVSVRVALTRSALRCSYNFLPQKRRLKFLVSILERSPYALSCSFFPIRVHLFLSAPSSYAVQPCAHRSLRHWIVFRRRSSALQRVSVETNLPVRRTCRFEPEDITQPRNQMYLFIYVFFRCWNKVFSMYMSCTFNMFVYLCISQILLLGFLTTHLAQKTWYQFNIIWN